MTTTAPAPSTAPAGTEQMTPRQLIGLGVLCFTLLLISVDQTVLNVALPTLVKALHPSNSGLQWIADSYTLTNAVLLLMGGALGDRYGRCRMFLIGSGLFGLGSLACALVGSTGPLIAARASTGFGAALLMPATLSIIVSMFEGHSRARAIGIWAGIGGIGGAAGPLVGGVLLQHFWWGSVFLINVPIAAVAVIGGWYALPESRAENSVPLDPVAVLLSATGFALLTYAVIVAPTKHWGSPTVVGSLLISLVLIGVFLWWDGRSDNPLFDLSLFKSRAFSSGIAAITSLFFAMFGVGFLLSQYIQFVKGYDVLGVGIRFLPQALASLITSNITARFTARFGLRRVMLLGMGMVAAGIAFFMFVGETTSYLPVGIAFVLIGGGMGFAIAPASNAVVSSLPPDKIGAGSGLRSMVQLLGASFGVAIIGSVAASRYRSHVNHGFTGQLASISPHDRAGIADQIGHAVAVAGRLPASAGHALMRIADQGFVAGMHISAVISFSVVVLSMVGAAIFIPANAAPTHTGDDDIPELHV